MSKHTPGPWQYAFEGGTTAFITEADGSTIICIRTTENTTAHKDLAANARLIAAAPAMIEILKASLQAMEHLHRTGDTQVFDLCYAPELIPAIRNVIEQATGES